MIVIIMQFKVEEHVKGGKRKQKMKDEEKKKIETYKTNGK